MTTGAAGATGVAGATGAASTGATGAAQATGAQATGPIDNRLNTFKVPEKYEKEPWAKEVKNVDDLWEKMNGVQKLIGKDKIVLPGDNATSDEIEIFHKRMGRPDNPEGYEFKSMDALKEVPRNVDLDHGLKKIYFDEGISKTKAESIIAKSEALIYGMHKPVIEQSAQRNLDFQKLADETLGTDKVAAMDGFKSVMRETLGEKAYLADKLETMDNDQLLALTVYGKAIHDKYTGENRVIVKPGQQPGLSGDLKTDFQALSGQKLAIKTDTKMPEHIKKMKLSNINAQMTKIGAKASEQDIDLFK